MTFQSYQKVTQNFRHYVQIYLQKRHDTELNLIKMILYKRYTISKKQLGQMIQKVYKLKFKPSNKINNNPDQFKIEDNESKTKNEHLRHQFKNMSLSQFDWYRLSLITQQKPQVQNFQQIIRTGDIKKSIDRVPMSYKINLLNLFQVFSGKMKQQTKTMDTVNSSLKYRKDAVADRIQSMQENLQESKNQLVRMKAMIQQKKKMPKKLKQKIQTLKRSKRSKSQQVYFCPLCSRNDFASRQIFTFHMFSQHQTFKSQQQNNLRLSMPNNSSSSSAHNQLKDFIMTLKDKEMQMMRMILSQKKEMQTLQLEKLYEKEINLMTMKNNSEPHYLSKQKQFMSQGKINSGFYGQDQGQGDGQLKGESQFLFYQKSQKYSQAALKGEYSLKKALEERKKQLDRHPYYDIFKDMQQNKSFNLEEQMIMQARNNKNYSEQSNQRGQTYPAQQQRQPSSHRSASGGFRILQKFQLKSNQQLTSNPTAVQAAKVQPLKISSANLQCQQFNPSITDRLKQQQIKNGHNNSIYSSFGRKTATRGMSAQHQYVFNSGPLVNDDGSHSDYQDYFGQQLRPRNKQRGNDMPRLQDRENNPTQQKLSYSMSTQQKPTVNNLPLNCPSFQFPTLQSNQSFIQDQQIKLNPGSYSFVSKQQYSKQHISFLLSPNKQHDPSYNSSRLREKQGKSDSKYGIYHNNNSIDQRQSEIGDLSDSFSRRDFELSKDQLSVNLSELKLSKLQKKRAQQKQNQRHNHPQRVSPPAYRQEFGCQNRLVKKPSQYVLVSQEKHIKLPQTIEQPEIRLLNQFQRKIQSTPSPLLPAKYGFQKKQTYQFSQFYKQSPPTGSNKQFSNDVTSRLTNNLNAFVRNEVKVEEKIQPNVQQQQSQSKVISPQQFFANQMKKASSYGSFNQKVNINNPQSYVSNSISQSSQSQPPKVYFREYEKIAYSNHELIPYSNHELIPQRSSLNRQSPSLQMGKSLSRQKRKLQIHQDLLSNGNQGLLNQFFKKQFRPSQQRARVNINTSKSSHSYSRQKQGQQGDSGTSALDEFIK